MNKYYIPYDETYKVNYNYILAFYNLAKYNKQTKTYNIVFYDSKKDLLKRI